MLYLCVTSRCLFFFLPLSLISLSTKLHQFSEFFFFSVCKKCSILENRLHKINIYILPHMIIIVIWIAFDSPVLATWLLLNECAATLQRSIKFGTKYKRRVRLVIGRKTKEKNQHEKTRTQKHLNVKFLFV